LFANTVEEGEEPPPTPATVKAVAIKRLLFSLVFIHAFVQVSGNTLPYIVSIPYPAYSTLQ
jgi:hypothetical protein